MMLEFESRITFGISANHMICLSLAIVVEHGLTEINQHGHHLAVTSGTHHYVVGLYIEMKYLLIVQISKRSCHKAYYAEGFLLGKHTTTLQHILVERRVAKMLHNIINRVVLLEHFIDGHYALVLQSVQYISLSIEISLGSIEA